MLGDGSVVKVEIIVFVRVCCVCAFMVCLYVYGVFVRLCCVCAFMLCLYIHAVFVHPCCVCTFMLFCVGLCSMDTGNICSFLKKVLECFISYLKVMTRR